MIGKDREEVLERVHKTLTFYFFSLLCMWERTVGQLVRSPSWKAWFESEHSDWIPFRMGRKNRKFLNAFKGKNDGWWLINGFLQRSFILALVKTKITFHWRNKKLKWMLSSFVSSHYPPLCFQSSLLCSLLEKLGTMLCDIFISLYLLVQIGFVDVCL